MAVSPVRQHHMVLPEIDAETLQSVREIVRILLRVWRKSELEFVTELGVMELLTNVLKHTPGDCELLVREMPDGVLVGVTDSEDELPAVKEPDEEAEGGRGLYLLSCLADELESQPLLRGKQIWFRTSAAPGGAG